MLSMAGRAERPCDGKHGSCAHFVVVESLGGYDPDMLAMRMPEIIGTPKAMDLRRRLVAE
jgi:hypothetical protein